jgi:predicted ester cyclase
METSPKSLVERFYFEVWNRADEKAAREILHPDFRFRASLGPEKRGPDGFIEYMRSIHVALADYTCVIDDLITTENRAAARMTFRGRHRSRFFDEEPTGREIRWAGGAFFTTDGKQIVELWVLGDVDSVKQQLSANRGAASGDEHTGDEQSRIGRNRSVASVSLRCACGARPPYPGWASAARISALASSVSHSAGPTRRPISRP